MTSDTNLLFATGALCTTFPKKHRICETMSHVLEIRVAQHTHTRMHIYPANSRSVKSSSPESGNKASRTQHRNGKTKAGRKRKSKKCSDNDDEQVLLRTSVALYRINVVNSVMTRKSLQCPIFMSFLSLLV